MALDEEANWDNIGRGNCGRDDGPGNWALAGGYGHDD